jgi:phosphoethanolamine N-methyltransferase
MNFEHNAEEIDRLERPEILSYLPAWEGKTVLDLPAGIGRFTSEFAPKAEKVVAVDFCHHFLKENRKRNKDFGNIEYLCSDAMDLEFPPSSFDLIFTSWIFQYLEDEEVITLSERVASWLKPEGQLFVRESCSPTRRNNPNPSYPVIYRTIPEYPPFFEKRLSLIQEGNVKTYEDLNADPFKCYWIFSK